VRPPRRLSAALLACVALTACATAGPEPAQQPVRSHQAPLWIDQDVRPTKVLVVVEENHTAGSALRGMPYLASLATTYGRATSYKALTHPSLPNYLAIAGGSTFGVRDDRGPLSHRLTGPSVFDRVLAAGRTAKTYAESMPAPCALTGTAKYAVRHNPWTYFADPASRASCRRFDVPSGTAAKGALRTDIDRGTLPDLGLLIPDICNDAHDCSLATADAWLKTWLTAVQRGPDYRAGRLAVVVTFDEDDNSADNTVLTVVMSPRTSHVVVAAPLDHYSLTRLIAELTGTAPLRSAASARSMRAAFHL
jgi:acid phosphatase